MMAQVKTLLAMLVFLASSAYAKSAFEGGLEPFDGTALDSTTWDAPKTILGTTVTQEDSLRINVSDLDVRRQEGRYNTSQAIARVGDTVSVEMTLLGPVAVSQSVLTYAGLALTTKDNAVPGTGPSQLSDTLVLFNAVQRFGGEPQAPNALVYGTEILSGTSAGGRVIAENQPFLGTSYELFITRLSPSLTRCRARPLGGAFFSTVADEGHLTFEGPLFISLYATGVAAQFDNVRIVPEPSGAMMLLVVTAWNALRRGQRCSYGSV